MIKIEIEPVIEPEFLDACKTMHISKEDFINVAIICLLHDKSEFIICPTCASYLSFKSTVDTPRPVKRLYCKCGSTIYYEVESEFIINWKKRKGFDFR